MGGFMRVVMGFVLACLCLFWAGGFAEEGRRADSPSDQVALYVPRTISYQGMLKNAVGDPVPDSTYNLTFRIYDRASGGAAIWTSPLTPTSTAGGSFHAYIGPIPLPFDTTYYLSVQVQGDTEMGRLMMAMVPYSASADTANYAFKADTADFALGGGSSHWTVSDSVLYTNGYWGIARGEAGNLTLGDSAHTHTNLGNLSTTGRIDRNVGYCTVGGGYQNVSSEWGATVCGGIANAASDTNATVAGGVGNGAAYWGATVGGGRFNCACGRISTVGGGGDNRALGIAATIGGGEYQETYGDYSFIGGGVDNRDWGPFITIGGGYHNTAGDEDIDTAATICGGRSNSALSKYAVIGGGNSNTASGDHSFVGSGYHNQARSEYSSIINGFDNVCEGYGSTVLGGVKDTILNGYSTAFGYHVYLSESYRVAFFCAYASGRFAINRDSQNGISYPIHVGTVVGDGNGAYLSASGVWTNGSSRAFKENGRSVVEEGLLDKISNLPVDHYNFISSNETHIGPYAEDFVAAFDVGAIRESDGKRDDQYLAASDVAGVALAGVQELLKKIDTLEKRVAELEAQQGRR